MKRIITLTAFFVALICSSTFCQSNFGKPKDSTNFEVKINPDFFLLGTFSDYMGRFQSVDSETQIDRYYPHEESLAIYISDFINQHYNTKTKVKFKESRHSEIVSPVLAKQLHSLYFDRVGNFKDEKLNSEEEMYSFLLGTYYRYGTQLEGNIYKIQVANSPKDKQLYRILKELECDKIIYKFLRGYIPSSDIFYFVATPRMIKYFNTIDKKKVKEHKQKYNDAQKILIESLKLI